MKYILKNKNFNSKLKIISASGQGPRTHSASRYPMMMIIWNKSSSYKHMMIQPQFFLFPEFVTAWLINHLW